MRNCSLFEVKIEFFYGNIWLKGDTKQNKTIQTWAETTTKLPLMQQTADSLLAPSMWRDDFGPIPLLYLWGHYLNVGSGWEVGSSWSLMLQCWRTAVNHRRKEKEKKCPNIYSEWQNKACDCSNLITFCVGCKHTSARKIIIPLL